MPISEAIKTALAQGTGHFVTVVRVTAKPSRGGDEIAYALHTRDVVYDGTTFIAAPFEPSKMQQTAGTQADNATLNHVLGDLFDKANIKGGKWAGARIELMCLDTNQLAEGPARRHLGRVGDVNTGGQEAQTEFRGLMQLLSQEIGDRTSRRCRLKLGSPECGVDIADFTFPGTVAAITNQQRFDTDTNEPDEFFNRGRIIWTSGLNDGLEMEVVTNDGGEIVLFLPMPSLVQVGDDFDLIAGDDKSLLICHTRFDNAVNFGGEDSLPIPGRVFKFPE